MNKVITVVKKGVRGLIESTFPLVLGKRYGGRLSRHLVRRLRQPLGRPVPYKQYEAKPGATLLDDGVPLTDAYCPICDDQKSISQVADQVGPYMGVTTRKILFRCDSCQFLFTNESRGDRSDFFVESPYKTDHSGRRSDREVDLVDLSCKMLGLEKGATILAYALGKNDTLQKLVAHGYKNSWGSDIAEGLDYDERFINMDHEPDYFDKRGIKFDIVTAVEVWEHYDRNSMNDAFRGLFDLIQPNGMVIGTTTLQVPENVDPVFNGPDEWGQGQLDWWDYPHAHDHTSFYQEANLTTIAQRFGMHVSFGYFADKASHSTDPFKRIMAFVKADNLEAIATLEEQFSRHFHNVSY